MYDIIIIGGGITGLYSCYNLLKKNSNLKICVIEQSGRWGGRIYTKNKDGLSFESGAGRFHSSHKYLMKLLKELNLENKCIPLSKNVSYFLKNQWIYNDKQLMKLYNSSFKSLDDIWKFIYSNLPNDYSSTLYQHCLNIGLSKDETDCLKDTFGYTTEFTQLNSKNALDIIKFDFSKNENYFVLMNGLQQVINSLVDKCSKMGATLLLNTPCISINTSNNEINTDKNIINSKKIFITIPINSLNSIQIIPNIKWSKNKQPIPYNLLRIYAKYPTSWFKNINKIITDKKISMIIPINYKTGLIMISYTDNVKATYWNNIENLDLLKKELSNELDIIFPNINIPEPEWISLEYWNEGCHAWGTNMDDNKIMNDISKQFGNNIFLINEAYSHLQGWIEGSLEMTHNILDNLKIGGVNKYTKDDIKKHNTLSKGVWTIINNKVYDITKWVPQHPGGVAKIMQIAGRDGTELFMNNPFHKGHNVNKILEKYYIGELE